MPQTRSAVKRYSANLLLLLGVLMTSSMVRSETLNSPLRLRFNVDLIKGVFHKQDQDILNVFANMSLGYVDFSNGDSDAQMLSDITASLVPVEGIEHKDFDFLLSLDEQKFIGMESSHLRVKGTGNIRIGKGEEKKSEEFSFEAPVDQFKIEYTIG